MARNKIVAPAARETIKTDENKSTLLTIIIMMCTPFKTTSASVRASCRWHKDM